MKFHVFSERADKKQADDVLEGFFGSVGARNGYFSMISGICRFIEFAFLFGLIIYVAVSATVNAGKITRENIQYIFRNFAFRLDKNSEISTEIIYSPDSGQSFALYGQGLAVAGNSGIRIFSATGRNTCSSDFVLASARLTSSSVYAGVYEFGGKDYYIFNSFSKVYHGTSENEIYGMSVSDSGKYVILSGDSEFASSVLLYRSNFSLQTAYRKNSRVISAVLDREGTMLLTATVDVNSSGQYSSEIELYSVEEEKRISDVALVGRFPLKCFFTDDGYGILCKDRVIIWSKDGVQLKEVAFGDREAVAFDNSGELSAVLLKETGKGLSVNFHLLMIPHKVGSETETVALSSTPVSLSVFSDTAYVLADSRIFAYNTSGLYAAAELTGKPEGKYILAYAEGKVYYLCNSSAYTVGVSRP
ncbi:MAG: DUF5711 family protein [Clostridia bacterium]|nr:DUF5711 family protein [Clostridia bacterium]